MKRGRRNGKLETVSPCTIGRRKKGFRCAPTNPPSSSSMAVTYLVSDVIHHDRSGSSPVIHGRQAAVSLLSRGIPDLELHRGVIELNLLRKERRFFCCVCVFTHKAFKRTKQRIHRADVVMTRQQEKRNQPRSRGDRSRRST